MFESLTYYNYLIVLFVVNVGWKIPYFRSRLQELKSSTKRSIQKCILVVMVFKRLPLF